MIYNVTLEAMICISRNQGINSYDPGKIYMRIVID